MSCRVVEHALDLQLFFPILQRVIDTWPKNVPVAERDAVSALLGRGFDMSEAMMIAGHYGATAAPLLPQLAELKRWQQLAFALSSRLSELEPEWFASYWYAVFQDRYPVPSKVMKSLRRAARSHGMPWPPNAARVPMMIVSTPQLPWTRS